MITLRIQLTIPDPTRPLLMVSDASAVMVSFCLYEIRDDGLALILSDSKLLSASKTKAAAVEREYLSMQYMLTRCESYIRQCEKKCLVASDARSIQFLIRSKGNKPALVCFANYSASFENVEYLYLPGKIV